MRRSTALILTASLTVAASSGWAEESASPGLLRLNFGGEREFTDLPYVSSIEGTAGGRVVLAGKFNPQSALVGVADPAKQSLTAFRVPASDIVATATSDGDVVLAGMFSSPALIPPPPWKRAAFILRMAQNGSIKWSLRIDAGFIPTGIKATTTGRLVVVGSMKRPDPADRLGAFLDDALALQFSADGSLLWSKDVYEPGNTDMSLVAVTQTPDGGVYVLTGGGRVFQMTEAGEVVWARKITLPDRLRAHLLAVAALPSGVALAGQALTRGASGYDALAVRLDQTGNPLWASVMDAGPDDSTGNLAVGASGEIILTGSARIMGATLEDRIEGQQGLMLRVDEAGRLVWACTLGPGDDGYLGTIARWDGGLLGSGVFHSGVGSNRAWLPILVGWADLSLGPAGCKAARVGSAPVSIRVEDASVASRNYALSTEPHVPALVPLPGSMLTPFADSISPYEGPN